MDQRSRVVTFIIALAVAALASACASSNIASFRDPAAGSGKAYERIIAVAANLPLEQRQTAEASMVEALAAMGKSGIPGMQVMPDAICSKIPDDGHSSRARTYSEI